MTTPDTTMPAMPEASSDVSAALRRWASLGVAQGRVARSLVGEVERASQDIAAETATVSSLFQQLATRAAAQSARVAELAAMAGTTEVLGRSVPLVDVAAMFEGALDGIISKILQLSQHAMSMVYALDEVSSSMEEVEQCIANVDGVNRQTRMLSINARIESARAGVSGLAFGVIADEVRGLSNSTETLSDSIRAHVGAVVTGLRESHGALRTVATLDMSENIMAKDHLDQLVTALVQRGKRLGEIAHRAALDADEISRQVGLAITSLQFQDRVAQRLGQVMDTLRMMEAAAVTLDAETAHLAGAPTPEEQEQETAWLRSLADRYRLSEMRAAFLAQVVDGGEAPPAPAAPVDDAGSIELF